jgi:hypothetical protein
MPRGGKRKGAGRPKGTTGIKHKATIKAAFDKELLRQELRDLVRAHLTPLTQAQIANAMGIKYLVARERKGGKFVRLDEAKVKAILAGEESEHEVIEVWEKDPSILAFSDLLNRTIDKPTETVTQTSELNATIEIKWQS